MSNAPLPLVSLRSRVGFCQSWVLTTLPSRLKAGNTGGFNPPAPPQGHIVVDKSSTDEPAYLWFAAETYLFLCAKLVNSSITRSGPGRA